MNLGAMLVARLPARRCDSPPFPLIFRAYGFAMTHDAFRSMKLALKLPIAFVESEFRGPA